MIVPSSATTATAARNTETRGRSIASASRDLPCIPKRKNTKYTPMPCQLNGRNGMEKATIDRAAAPTICHRGATRPSSSFARMKNTTSECKNHRPELGTMGETSRNSRRVSWVRSSIGTAVKYANLRRVHSRNVHTKRLSRDDHSCRQDRLTTDPAKIPAAAKNRGILSTCSAWLIRHRVGDSTPICPIRSKAWYSTTRTMAIPLATSTHWTRTRALLMAPLARSDRPPELSR